MSDELPAGSMTLEGDDGQQAEIVSQPIGAAPVEDPEPEGTVEIPTGKVVPLGALQAERGARKEADRKAADLEQRLTLAEQKAQHLDRIKDEWDQVQPLIQRVRQQAAAPPPPQETPKALSDADAVEYAKDLDLYKTDGTPDVDRAQRLASRQERISAKYAQQAMAPLQANEAQRNSSDMRQRVGQMKDPYGYQVDPAILDEVWRVVPAELSAQPNVAGVLHRVALAEAILKGKHPALKAGQAPSPVVATEGIGAPQRVESDTPSRFASAAGISQAEFKKTASGYKPGASNVLEG